MKRITLFSLMLAMIMSASPVDAKKFKWDDARQIEAGMSKAQVTELVGKPYSVVAQGDGVVRYVWVHVSYFTGASRSLVVDFDAQGHVIAKPQIPEEFK